MEVMADGAIVSIFAKRVKEPSNDFPGIRYRTGLALQVAIPDSKASSEYTENLAKAMTYLNENGSHPILFSKVFLPFGKAAAIDNETFRNLIT
jgi:hypothetical protein